MEEQNYAENKVLEIQQIKDADRKKLIDSIVECNFLSIL
jgi:hypothetical protein